MNQRMALLALVIASAAVFVAAQADSVSAEDRTTMPTIRTGEIEYSMARPEGNRTFWAYIPTNYTGQQPLALVFAFHGLGDNCWNFGHETGFVTKAEAEGFLLVYPCGTPGGFFFIETAWNAGTCCMEGSKISDIDFAREMVQFMSANYNVDPKRVFSSGFSNGAFMTETLMCNSSDVFQAGASVSGTVVVMPGNKPGLANCDAEHAAVGVYRPFLHIHGNADPVVPWTGDELLGFPDIPTDFARWAERNKCTGSPVQTFSNGPYSNQVYQTCANPGQTVELVKHELGGHEWPSDKYFDTTNYIWDFFSKINVPEN